MVLQKDNAPAYLLSFDSLLLEVDICDETLEVVFSKQMEKSIQMVEIIEGLQPRRHEENESSQLQVLARRG